MAEELLYEAVDGVAIITVNRPHRRNAFDRATAEALATALDRLDSDPSTTVGIITGADGFFCAGMDLKALAENGGRPLTESRGALGIVSRPPEKPLIAAVEGSALGGGFELALACDLIVAALDARFGLPEVKRGMVAAAGGVIRLPRNIPRAVALEIALTGEPISARRGYELGLVNRVVEPGRALAAAQELAGLIAANAPLAVKLSKTIMYESADWPTERWFEHQAPMAELIRDSEDAAEGARAFAEKRPPVWTGR
jgi:enoyl-CoA hydratase/carnithine racemase